MTTVTHTQSTLLRNAVRANGIFSTICALILLALASPVRDYLDAGDTNFYVGLGAILLFHACVLFYGARANDVNRQIAWYAILGDIGWVIATVYILLTDSFNISTGGKWLILGIGDIVLCFAVAQYLGLRRQDR